MSDRYGSYRHDRFVFGPESTVVPLVVRFVSSLFFSLYERLWRGATVVAETGMAFPFGPAVFSVYPL